MAKLITLENLKTFLDRLRKDLNAYAKKSDIPDMTAYAKKSDIQNIFPSGTAVDDYCVPDGTETVTNGMFEKYYLNEKAILLFPPSVRKIEERPSITDDGTLINNAFMVSLPQCTYVGEYAFSYYHNLVNATIPNCIHIGMKAFYGCFSLTNVVLLNCKYISNLAFKKCLSLKSIFLPSCTQIESNAFHNCPNLTEIVVSENLERYFTFYREIKKTNQTITIYNPSRTKKITNVGWVNV